MKSKQLYFYIGIILVILPFIGFYQYLKNSIYIISGIILMVNSRNATTNLKTTTKPPVRRPAIRKQVDNIEEIKKENEL